MKAENKAVLDRYRHNYETLKAADYIGHLELGARQELLRVAREEYNSSYTCCVTCGEDVFQLVKYVYGQEEKQMKEDAKIEKELEQVIEEVKPEETVVKKATFPKQEKAK